jgi:hypothetical protein
MRPALGDMHVGNAGRGKNPEQRWLTDAAGSKTARKEEKAGGDFVIAT